MAMFKVRVVARVSRDYGTFEVEAGRAPWAFPASRGNLGGPIHLGSPFPRPTVFPGHPPFYPRPMPWVNPSYS